MLQYLKYSVFLMKYDNKHGLGHQSQRIPTSKFFIRLQFFFTLLIYNQKAVL